MKYFVLTIFLMFGTHAFSEEVEGKDAKNIILNGDVMGSHLIDEYYLKMLGSEAGTFFSVKSGKKIYTCYFVFGNGYFCSSLD